MKIKLNKKGEWEELPKHSREGIYNDRAIWLKILNIWLIIGKLFDCVFIIDGKEGSGKSIFALTLAWILTKGKLTVDNISEGGVDAIRKLKKLPDKSLLIIDEGGLMFSSKEVMRREQIRLIKILQVIRQKNMILIIVAPSFFDLNKYISVERSKFLLHVYTDKKMNRGFFAYFSEKKKRILYELGKKNYNSYARPKSNFRGRFTNFKVPFYSQYLETKKRTLMEVFDEKKPEIDARFFEKEVYKKILQHLEIVEPPLLQKQKVQLMDLSPKTIRKYEKEAQAKGKKGGDEA